jgi:uncharacterized OB-fold protein
MTESPARPLPNIDDPLYEGYFRALAKEQLVAQSCHDCGHVQWPPRDFCFRCHKNDLGWESLDDSGMVYTYNVSYRAFHPWFRDQVPYAVLVVELERGIRMLGRYRDGDTESVECGMPVKAHYQKLSEDTTVLEWQKA